MSNQTFLETEDRWTTAMGKAFLCERVVLRGKDLHHDLGRKDWFGLYFFSVTGRWLSDAQLKMMNFFWVATSFPDPSIWPNQAAALGGTARTTASLALMAGLSISEASIYGRRPERRALDFFYRIGDALKKGVSLGDFIEQELQETKIIYGYGRPLAKLDERIPPTLQMAEELGLHEGYHFKIALDIYRYLKETRGLSMNIAAINTALIADMGLSGEEYQLFVTTCFITGMTPCYIDARDKPEGSFFPTRCTSIQYSGKPKRDWESF